MQQHTLMVGKIIDNLLRAELLPDQLPYPLSHLSRQFAALVRLSSSIITQTLSLLWPITSQSLVAPELPTDRRLTAPHQLGYLFLAVLGFLEYVNLVSFRLGQLVVTHKCLFSWRRKVPSLPADRPLSNCTYYPNPPCLVCAQIIQNNVQLFRLVRTSLQQLQK